MKSGSKDMDDLTLSRFKWNKWENSWEWEGKDYGTDTICFRDHIS